MSKNINIYCKVVLFGEEGCGKGKIKEFFLNYIEEKKNSIIASSETRKIDGLGENIEFEVWDTPGNRRYISTMIKPLLINANVVILVYDITNKETFFEIKYFWYNYIKENAPKDISN